MNDDLPALEVYFRKWNDNGAVARLEIQDAFKVLSFTFKPIE